jgi:hypothetical protein
MKSLPTVGQPEAIEKAVAIMEAREADLADAEQAVGEAKAGLESARAEDVAAFAAARDAGVDDPGPVHVQHARQHLADAERRRDGETLRLGRAQAALKEALEAHVGEWNRALERSLQRADAASIKALDRLEAAERERAELRGARATLRQGRPVSAGPIPSPIRRNLSGDLFTLNELLAGLRAGLENSSLDRERERAAEREAAEHEAEQARERRRRLTEAVP